MDNDYIDKIAKEGFIVVQGEEEGGKVAELCKGDNSIKLDRIGSKFIFYKDDAVNKPLKIEDLISILSTTVKRDDTNKVITFLSMLTAYTEDSQCNVSFRAPSSTGKSHIPLETSSYFPEEDLKIIAYSSPTSFYHDNGTWDDERKVMIVDLERKILIFLDQPHDQLLQRLRTLLSHDKKELLYKITDKREKSGTRTKNVIIRGFPSVIFCTGSLKIDEQEATRSFILSPEIDKEKIKEGIILKALRKGNPNAFREFLGKHPERELLTQRIRLIKQANISYVIVKNYELLSKRFLAKYPKLKSRNQRDIDHIISLITGLALLNFWHREKDIEGVIYANEQDIEDGFNLFDKIAESQELGIAPYVHDVFRQVIKPLFLSKNTTPEANIGLERREISAKYYEIYNKAIPEWSLKQDILTPLESAGLIYQAENPQDKRKMLVFLPAPPLTSIYPASKDSLQKYIETQGGVKQSGDAVCEFCNSFANCSLYNGKYACQSCLDAMQTDFTDQ